MKEAGDLNWFDEDNGFEASGDAKGFKEDRLFRDNGEKKVETDVGEDDEDNDESGAGDETAVAPEEGFRFKSGDENGDEGEAERLCRPSANGEES